MCFFLVFFFEIDTCIHVFGAEFWVRLWGIGASEVVGSHFKIARIVSVFASRRLRYFYFFREKFHKERYKAH